MNGSMDGAFDVYGLPPKVTPEQLRGIADALNATLDPRTTNDVRQQAYNHLEHIKGHHGAPYYGFSLADDWTQNDAVRYYGLQLLEHVIRYRWTEYSESQTEQLRTWVKCLAGGLREHETLFIRNKIAQLWAEVAKRCWGGEWMDMDKLLITMWDQPIAEKGAVNKVFVLYVLEMLSEDTFQKEDPVAALRSETLFDALREIMATPGTYADLVEANKTRLDVRGGEEGWLVRMCDFFSWCVKQAHVAGPEGLVESLMSCAIKTLQALRPTIGWTQLKAVSEANLLDCVCLSFQTEDVALQTAAAECLYALLHRPNGQTEEHEFVDFLQRALDPHRIALIRHAFGATQTAPGEDQDQYTLQKKLSDVVSKLADAVAKYPDLASAEKQLDMPSFFNLLVVVLQSSSLVVSVPVLYSWLKFQDLHDGTVMELISRYFGSLIQTCSARLLRYESVSEDAEDEISRFLSEDFDTQPELHAFLGNYRRYCVRVIQFIAHRRPTDALMYALVEMKTMLETGAYVGARGFDSATYSKTSMAVLHFDALYQLVSSTLKGVAGWIADVESTSPEDSMHSILKNKSADVTNSLQQWSYSLIDMHIDDPEVATRVLQTLVSISLTIKPDRAFLLHVVQHVLTMRLYDNPAHETFSEAVRSFELLRVLELQRLAVTFSTELLDVYADLEPKIGVLVEKFSDDTRLVWGYKAFLYMVIHRASGLNSDVRIARLQNMVHPVYEAWQDQSFGASLASLESLCARLGLAGLADFYKTYRFDQTADWSSAQLDDVGQARLSEIKAKNDTVPLRMTKTMLQVAMENISRDSDEFQTSCEVWCRIIPNILPNLLLALRHAQAFHNMANWANLPEEMQMVVQRTLQDRFWQSGISNESKDEFHARVSGSKSSYEGFGSAVRGTMRAIRDHGYHILYLMTKFDEQFFGLPDLSEPLAEALFADVAALPSNHVQSIINLSTALVQRCPPHHRARFLSPLLEQLFRKMDGKITNDWDAIERASRSSGEDEELGDEMRSESVLRQLTYATVTFVALVVHFDKLHPSAKPTIRDTVLSHHAVVEPLILFCTHTLRMRDTRCCLSVCKIFRVLVNQYQSGDGRVAEVREFICTEVLKACITSLNEPYFADMQKDLAALIAQIVFLYAPKTETPRNVLLSLPDMSAATVDKTIGKICKSQNERSQRAFVLVLLERVRGVSIYEQGKIANPPPPTKKKVVNTPVQQHHMEVEPASGIVDGGENGLEDVAALFGGL